MREAQPAGCGPRVSGTVSGDGGRVPGSGRASRRARADPGTRPGGPRRHAGRGAPTSAARAARAAPGPRRVRRRSHRRAVAGASGHATRWRRCTTTSSGSAAACPTASSSRSATGTASTRRASTSTPTASPQRCWTPSRPDPVASATIDEVLDRWHGPAYPELDDVDDGPGRVRAPRRAADPGRGGRARERGWRTGDTDGLVVELAALADEEPLRERPRALLMAALADAGRHVEALRVYDDFRRLLGDELGIEPSPALAAQHAGLLGGTDAAAWTPPSRLPVPVTSLVGRDVARRRAGGDGRRRTARHADRTGRCGQDPAARRGRRTAARRAPRPPRRDVRAGHGDRRVGRRRRRRRAGDRWPPRRRPRRAGGRPCSADTEIVLLLDNCEHVLDPVAELVERLLATCPQRDGRGDQPGAPARRRRAAVHACRRWRRLDRRTPRPCSCSSSGPAPWRPASTPIRASWPSSPRSSAGSTGCRWRSSWPRPGCTRSTSPRWPPASTSRFLLLSSGYRTSARHGSLSAAVSWSYGLLDETAATDLRRPVGLRRAVHGERRGGGLRRRRGHGDGRPGPARRALARDARARPPLRPAGDAAGVRRRAARRRRAGRRVGERHARHYVEWIEAADRRMLEPARPRHVAEIDAALPELRTALEWLLDHDEVDARRPSGQLACSTTGFCGCGPTSWRGRSGSLTPTPTTAARRAAVVWAVSGVRRLDGRRRRRDRRRAPPALAPSRARRAVTPPPEVCDAQRQLRAVRGAARRGRRPGTGGPRQRPSTIRRSDLMAASTRAAGARLRR